LDIFNPLFVTGFILALGRDFACLFLLGAAIPVVGQVLAFYALAFVVVAELFFIFAIRPQLQHFAPKLILVGLGILPVPLAGSLALILAVAAQNRLVELVLTQAAIQAVAVATGGAGEALEGAALAERGAAATEAVVGVAEGAEAVSGEVQVAGKAANRAESRLRRAGTRVEKRLRQHEEELKEELEGENEEEKGPSAEEIFGIKEPTEQTEELFEPEYNIPQNQGGEVENEIQARQKFEAQKQKETEERRAREFTGSMPIPMPPKAEHEVELEEAA
jgi:hypothetical protein